jgi:hypothetical protein
MHQPGYIQEGQETIFGYLLLGVYYRNSPGCTVTYSLLLNMSGIKILFWRAVFYSYKNYNSASIDREVYCCRAGLFGNIEIFYANSSPWTVG